MEDHFDAEFGVSSEGDKRCNYLDTWYRLVRCRCNRKLQQVQVEFDNQGKTNHLKWDFLFYFSNTTAI